MEYVHYRHTLEALFNPHGPQIPNKRLAHIRETNEKKGELCAMTPLFLFPR
jgi:hypothetical protein